MCSHQFWYLPQGAALTTLGAAILDHRGSQWENCQGKGCVKRALVSQRGFSSSSASTPDDGAMTQISRSRSLRGPCDLKMSCSVVCITPTYLYEETPTCTPILIHVVSVLARVTPQRRAVRATLFTVRMARWSKQGHLSVKFQKKFNKSRVFVVFLPCTRHTPVQCHLNSPPYSWHGTLKQTRALISVKFSRSSGIFTNSTRTVHSHSPELSPCLWKSWNIHTRIIIGEF